MPQDVLTIGSGADSNTLSLPLAKVEDVATVLSLLFPSKVDGYECVTTADEKLAQSKESCLLYGEFMPSGVCKVMDADHLNADDASSFYDLGMGLGKLCIQAFLMYPTLKMVVGVELARSRYAIAAEAVRRLHSMAPQIYRLDDTVASRDLIRLVHGERCLEFRCGDLFDTADVATADIVACELDIPVASFERFVRLLASLKTGARLVTLKQLEKFYETLAAQQQSRSKAANKPAKTSTASPKKTIDMPFVLRNRDMFSTSWNPVVGHPLGVWIKTESAAAS